MSGIPQRYQHRDYRFGNLIFELFKLRFDEFADTSHYDVKSGFRAGFNFGAMAVLQLLDEDEFASLVERFEGLFADELAIWAEHHA